MSDVFVGALVRVTGTFTLDPDAVFISVRSPSGTVTTEDGISAGSGQYYRDVDVLESGTWHVRVYSTGNGQAANEISFEANKSNFE